MNANGTASGLPAGCATFPQEIPSAAGGLELVLACGVSACVSASKDVACRRSGVSGV